MTEVPNTPNCWKVLRSAWMPAPPPESEPAMVRAIFIRVSASMSGSLLTTIRDLHRRRGRERRGLALAEGVRLVEEALAAGVPIRGAAVSPALEGTPRGSGAQERARARGRAPGRGERRRARRRWPIPSSRRAWSRSSSRGRGRWRTCRRRAGRVVLVLDAVQDPGNVGTILRTALGLGAAGVVALKGTAELHQRQGAARQHGRARSGCPRSRPTPTRCLAWARPSAGSRSGSPPPTASRSARGRRPRARPPVALVLGNEGAGVGAALVAPRRSGGWRSRSRPGVESLNVAVAAGILLYEVTRGA